jgi:hypothetical protein
MTEIGQERTCILSHCWPVSGQIPLTYEPLPAIAQSFSYLDVGRWRAKDRGTVKKISYRVVQRLRPGLSPARDGPTRGIRGGFVWHGWQRAGGWRRFWAGGLLCACGS